VIRGGKALLVRDRGKHHFSLPGGAVKKGEPAVSAAARELYEELGLHVVSAKRLRGRDFRGSVSEHKVCLIEVSGEPYLKSHEIDKFLWWDMKDDVPVYAHVKNILMKINEGGTVNGQ